MSRSATAWAEYVGTEYSGPIHICSPRSDLTMCGVTVQDEWVSRKPGLFSRQAVLPRGESLCRTCLWMTSASTRRPTRR